MVICTVSIAAPLFLLVLLKLVSSTDESLGTWLFVSLLVCVGIGDIGHVSSPVVFLHLLAVFIHINVSPVSLVHKVLHHLVLNCLAWVPLVVAHLFVSRLYLLHVDAPVLRSPQLGRWLIIRRIWVVSPVELWPGSLHSSLPRPPAPSTTSVFKIEGLRIEVVCVFLLQSFPSWQILRLI